jgi:hypothetical protein
MAKRTTRSTTPKSSKISSPLAVAADAMPADRAMLDGSAAHLHDSDTRADSMSSEPSEEEIRMRAYRRYLERGGGDGRDFDDWLEAERELKNLR